MNIQMKCLSRSVTMSLLGLGLSGSLPARADLNPRVDAEEVITTYGPAYNGAGPMWCYGSTCIVRLDGDVYASAIETGEGVPLLCNTRWQLWHRSAGAWTLAQHEQNYRQREPCPIAVFPTGPLFLSVNPSTRPAGTKHGPCSPLVLEFNPQHLAAAPKTNQPAWSEGTSFTEHSYRGFAADGETSQLLLLNINSKTSAQFVSHRDAAGKWHPRGTIEFPIRACYPQVALRNNAAHVMAIGDIVEPVKQWQQDKFKKFNRKWDYVFRRLFYTFTPDIAKKSFATPIEVDTADKTAGYIRNLDLFVDATGAAHLLYLKQPFHYEFMRAKYFPDQPMTVHLEYVIIKNGKVITRRTLAENEISTPGLSPSNARFHVLPNDRLTVVIAATKIDDAGKSTFANYIADVPKTDTPLKLEKIDFKKPFGNFMTATPRGGSKPSTTLDLFGTAGNDIRYAKITLSTE